LATPLTHISSINFLAPALSGASVPLVKAENWMLVTLMTPSGGITVATQTGQLTDSLWLPVDTPVTVLLSPGSQIVVTGATGSGEKILTVITQPLPLFANILATIARMFGVRAVA
jgi:hypothetical protein